LKREAWLLLPVLGLLAALPLGWPSFILLFFIPGFSIASLFKEKFTLVEAVAISLTVSILVIPMTALVTAPLPYHTAPYLLVLVAAIIGLYNYMSGRELNIEKESLAGLGIAAVLFLVVLLISLKTFSFQEGGLYYTFTHGLDQTFHLSIAQRYIAMPQVPPQDPYMAGYDIVYDWFMHTMLGEVCLTSGLPLLHTFKVVMAIVAALIFLDAYLLAKAIFKDDRAALGASLLYVLSSGLSWLYILLKQYPSLDNNTFLALVFQWPGITLLKYDPTSLYYFLPQPQTFGLLIAIFCFYMFIVAIRSRSMIAAIVTGVAMASLVFYHLITAFPVLVTILSMSFYIIMKDRDRATLVRLSAPIALSGIAVIIEFMMLPDNAGSQVTIGHHRDVLITFLVTLGPLMPFAIYCMYKLWDENGTKLLAIFAGVNAILINVFVLDMTNNTYRFLTYLTIPVALFAGKGIVDWIYSKNALKQAAALSVALVMIPSAFMIAGYYLYSPLVSLSSPMDVHAIDWIKENTPVNAVIYENPDHWPRVPILSGRRITFAGETYMKQYHGISRLGEMEAIMQINDSTVLHDKLARYGVNYVLIGGKEWYGPFAGPLSDTRYFKNVYDRDGFRVYEVIGVPIT
jgi:hypothetical protein